MSTFRAVSLGSRVMITHDTADCTIFSELDAQQAETLLRQLQVAVQGAAAALRSEAMMDA